MADPGLTGRRYRRNQGIPRHYHAHPYGGLDMVIPLHRMRSSRGRIAYDVKPPIAA